MIKSIKNGLDILACFSHETPEIGVTDIANKLSLSKSTVSRLLSTLQQGNLVIQIPPYQKYRLGPKILDLASIFLSNFEWRMIAIPHLKDLRDKADETVTVFIVQGIERICIEKFDSSHELRPVLNLGGHYPLHAGAAGKLLLAYLSPEIRKEILGQTGLPRLTPYTITTLKEIEHELAGIRRDGYAVSLAERALHVSSVAAPIRDFAGKVIAALNLSGPTVRFTREKQKEYVLLVAVTADKISRQIGYEANKLEAENEGD
jgi:IclR family transcriptional regulator, KDG regulon repressor